MKSCIRVVFAITAILTTLIMSDQAFAKDGGLYGVSSVGYAGNNLESDSLDTFSYKLSIGYELDRQWSLEMGYQGLGEDRLNEEEFSLDNRSIELTALHLSALGKASNRHGELFYRLGIARIERAELSLSDAVECEQGGSIIGMSMNYPVCQNSNSIIASSLGLGFDFYIHHNSLLRLEIEYLAGQDSYSATSIYLGFRLNF